MKSRSDLTKDIVAGIALLIFTGLLGLATARADQPLSKDEITVLILGGLESSNIIQRVEQRGIDFQMSPDLAKKFKDLGANDDLIRALHKAGNKAGATAPDAPPTPAGTKPTAAEALVTIPGGTQVRAELEMGISTRYSRAGEEVHASVIEAITQDGKAIIPVGTSLSGHIDFIQPRERQQKLRASFRIVFDTINLPGNQSFRCRAIISGVGFAFRTSPDGDVTQASGDFELKPRRKLWVQFTEDLALSAKSETTGAEQQGTSSPLAGATASGGLSRESRKSKLKDKHSVRMGELLVDATSIEDYPPNQRADPPHRIFVVHLLIQNVGKQFPCSSLKAYLAVEPLYEYPAWLLSEGQPSTSELLPGETVQGRYTFEIREGVIPKELLLKAQ